jgi:WhiB family transcriptional regulator, redox-sensing transcriptional regulator
MTESTATPCATGDPERWFPPHGAHKVVIDAVKAECADCPLIVSCREWATRHGEHGIWGGTTARERARIRSLRGTVAQPINAPARQAQHEAVQSMMARGFPLADIAAVLGITVAGASQACVRARKKAMSPAERFEQHHRINQRPVPCPQCGETVQAGNLARHRRGCRYFGGSWGAR